MYNIPFLLSFTLLVILLVLALVVLVSHLSPTETNFNLKCYTGSYQCDLHSVVVLSLLIKLLICDGNVG